MSMRTSCAVAAGLCALCLMLAAPCAPQVVRFAPGHSLPLEPLPTRSRANSVASRRDSVCDECPPPPTLFSSTPRHLRVTRTEPPQIESPHIESACVCTRKCVCACVCVGECVLIQGSRKRPGHRECLAVAGRKPRHSHPPQLHATMHHSNTRSRLRFHHGWSCLYFAFFRLKVLHWGIFNGLSPSSFLSTRGLARGGGSGRGACPRVGALDHDVLSI
jgi:hypothetical protein